MKRLFIVTALAASLSSLPLFGLEGPFTLAQPSAATQAVSNGRPEEKSAQVDALMARLISGDSPGAAVMIIKDGRVVHKKGYGLANVETRTPIGTDTAFDLASVSKQFTAMAVMMLAERGKLRFDDPLTKFFPQFPPYAEKITVRHLLNHTSGLPDYMAAFARVAKEGYQPSSKETVELLSKEAAPRFAPGEKWEYSNSGYVLLAMIAEKVSGSPFPKFVKENIFNPLGMNDSLVYDESKPAVKNRAVSYRRLPSGFKDIDYHPMNLIYGDGAVNTSVEDLYKWDQALYTEKLVKSETLRQAFTSGKLNSGAATGYGFGWGVGKYLGLDQVSHGGGWVGFRTYIMRFPAERFTVIVLSNFAQFNPGEVSQRIAKIYLRDKMSLPVATKVADDVLKKYAGHYLLDGKIKIEVTFENGSLYTNSPAKKRKLVPESEVKFFGEDEEHVRITFTKDAAGNVTGFNLSAPDMSLNARRVN